MCTAAELRQHSIKLPPSTIYAAKATFNTTYIGICLSPLVTGLLVYNNRLTGSLLDMYVRHRHRHRHKAVTIMHTAAGE